MRSRDHSAHRAGRVDSQNHSIDRSRNYPTVAGDDELEELVRPTITERRSTHTLDERRRIDDLAPEAELVLGGDAW